jgi:hypothetical protein
MLCSSVEVGGETANWKKTKLMEANATLIHCRQDGRDEKLRWPAELDACRTPEDKVAAKLTDCRERRSRDGAQWLLLTEPLGI